MGERYQKLYSLENNLYTAGSPVLIAAAEQDYPGPDWLVGNLAELDVLASESHAMAGRLREAGVTVEETTFPGVLHGFLRAMGHVKAADRAIAEAGGWLKRVLG